MGSVHLEIAIASDAGTVWRHLADLGSHATWMADAQAIRFVSSQTRGVGTEMEVPTRVGPLRTNDRMVVTAWEEGRSIAVRHTGLVSGEGRFVIEQHPNGAALLWTEDLRFPWWLGNGLTARLAAPILRAIWRRNLGRFKDLVEES